MIVTDSSMCVYTEGIIDGSDVREREHSSWKSKWVSIDEQYLIYDQI